MGLAIGAGFYFASIVSTVLILLNLVVFNKLERRYIRGKLHLITVHANTPNILDDISAVLEEQEFVIKKLIVNERSGAAYGEAATAVLGSKSRAGLDRSQIRTDGDHPAVAGNRPCNDGN